MHVAVGKSSPQCKQWSQCALDTKMKSYYAVNVNAASIIMYIFLIPPVSQGVLYHIPYERVLSWLVHWHTDWEVMFGRGISAGKTDPNGKMYKHNYVLLQCYYHHMKDLMWASSALVVIVMGCNGFNMINPMHLFMQCTLTDKNILILSSNPIVRGKKWGI